VPPGWAAPTSGYFFEEAALAEFATAAFTYEAESLAWQRAYWELDGRHRKALSDFDARLGVVAERHGAAVDAYEKEMSKARRRERLPGLGVFAGVGYGGDGVEPVIGVGLVWKLF
jgi:hypothetical protein